ncbi:MAG TPA: PepSY-like domain-containing protein [Ginsengibacter sp.]
MKKIICLVVIVFAINHAGFAQENENNQHINVPAKAKSALRQKYPEAKNVGWEKEDGNYEANWGGKSGEDNSVQFTPAGNFIEIVKAIPVASLPKPIMTYANMHYKGVKITEAGKVTDAAGKISYEVELKGKDVIFDEDGNFIKAEK